MWWSLTTAVIASATALVIAMLVYPYQRRLDRVHELQRERRELYRHFSATYRTAMDSILYGEYSDRPMIEDSMQTIISKLTVSAPDEIVEVVFQLEHGINTLHAAAEREDDETDIALLAGAVEETYRACLWVMRKDSFSQTKISSDLFSKDASHRLPARIKQ